jgi:hypothetical protein
MQTKNLTRNLWSKIELTDLFSKLVIKGFIIEKYFKKVDYPCHRRKLNGILNKLNSILNIIHC